MSRIGESGFEIAEHVLRSVECDAVAANLSSSNVLRSRAGARHLLSLPFVSDLASDPRLLAIATAALASDAFPFRATLFDKSFESNWSVAWHQDTTLPLRKKSDVNGWGPWSVKSGIAHAAAPTSVLDRFVALRVHLDESGATNGPLRVLPGTHNFGVLSEKEVAEVVRDSTAFDCFVGRGGVLAMKPLLIHASRRIVLPTPRRVLHIEYAADWHLAPGIDLAIA